MARRKHNHGREHVVETRGSQGGTRRYHCGVCKAAVKLRMRKNEVLARVPA
jgi:hypothetical protein